MNMLPPDVPNSLIGSFANQAIDPNTLSNNKFKFRIKKLPQTNWTITGVKMPGTSIPIVKQAAPGLNPIMRSGLNVAFEPLEIKFLVDGSMNNYIELFNWQIGLGMPTLSDQYKNLFESSFEIGPERGLYSDGFLTVLTNQSVPLLNVEFKDLFPFQLSGITFDDNVESPESIVATVSFAYTYFNFSKDI